MLVLMVAVFASIELRVFFEKGTETRDAFKMWHFMLGLAVFFIVWLRLFIRLRQKAPAIVPSLKSSQAAIAQIAHILLYGLMILMPLAGWFILSGEGKLIPFFGLSLPPLMAENKELAHTIEELHESAGLFAYYLIAFHALASLFHHYVQKDNTLTRMLP